MNMGLPSSLKRSKTFSIKLRYKLIIAIFFTLVLFLTITLAVGKLYQNWDKDPDRGAIEMEKGHFGESYSTPIYLDQGWTESDSLWFYNTTQGSALMPYDLFMALETAETTEYFHSNRIFDRYRYLPQKPTFFNPDGLAVGFVKDHYQGTDYIGYTCAACHTGQINFQGKAIRIDGGPAMADMVNYLNALQKAMEATLANDEKLQRFIKNVIQLDNNYTQKSVVTADLKKWMKTVRAYNIINHSNVDYGYARLDAFGRIYNRVLEHVINKPQLKSILHQASKNNGERILSVEEIDTILKDIDETVISSDDFSMIIERLSSDEPGYPHLSMQDFLSLRDTIFNEPNAPVSYPFLWDISHSDYVQWNGIANNAGLGPLGRNAGEVIGVFGLLEWSASEPAFSLAAKLTGQNQKRQKINFKSSIDLINLQRLESHLKSLKSPAWPENILGKIDKEKAERGELIYGEYCQSCHEIIDRNNWDRIVIASMDNIDLINTDPAMAENSVNYTGKSGNFKHTYQNVGVGTMIMPENAPVAQILTAATTGIVATPDPDKNIIRRWLDWIYTLGASLFDNEIKTSMKRGSYYANTQSSPYQSLLAYKARSLNGIWATAPYLHNGSVANLYELFLPIKREGDPEDGEYRTEAFFTGSREFDPEKVGFRHEGYDGFLFTAEARGNLHSGHEYAAGKTPQHNGEILPPLTKAQKWDLIEFLKTL